jgi:hypothetical protein
MDHSLKLYLWRDTQSSDIHSHTLSYYSQAEKELVFPLLWFHGTCTRQKPSSKTLLLHFRLPANSSYTKTGHVMEAKDEGHLYVPPKYKALLVKHQSLTVKFENVSGKSELYPPSTMLTHGEPLRLHINERNFRKCPLRGFSGPSIALLTTPRADPSTQDATQRRKLAFNQ